MVEYVAPSFVLPSWLPPILLAVGFVCVGVLIAAIRAKFERLFLMRSMLFIGTVACVAMVASVVMDIVSMENAKGKMADEAKSLYTSVPGQSIDVLFAHVTARHRPSHGFSVVSTVPLEPVGDADSFTTREVSLVWNGEGYILASSVDGEKFVRLAH